MDWKDFLHFRKEERIAIILLFILIVVTLTASMLANLMRDNTSPLPDSEYTAKFEEFINNITPTEEAVNIKEVVTTADRTNTITSKVPIEQRPKIEKEKEKEKEKSGYKKENEKGRYQQKIEKFYLGEKIRINEQDTLLWRRVPGIGSAFARRIVKYGNLLGGYASIKQLKEVYGLDEELFLKIEPYIEFNDSIRKIEINRFTFKQILSHPYINYEQTKAIVNERKKKKSIRDIEHISSLKIFSDEEIDKLSPYIDFTIE